MMNNVLFPDEITGEMLLNQNINEIPTLLEPLVAEVWTCLFGRQFRHGEVGISPSIVNVSLCWIEGFPRDETERGTS